MLHLRLDVGDAPLDAARVFAARKPLPEMESDSGLAQSKARRHHARAWASYAGRSVAAGLIVLGFGSGPKKGSKIHSNSRAGNE